MPQQLRGALPADTVESEPWLRHVLEEKEPAVRERPLYMWALKLLRTAFPRPTCQKQGVKKMGCSCLIAHFSLPGMAFTSLVLFSVRGFHSELTSGKECTEGPYNPSPRTSFRPVRPFWDSDLSLY